MSPSRGSSGPRDRTCVSCVAGRFLTSEPLGKPIVLIYRLSKDVNGTQMNLYQGIYIRIAWDAFPHAFPHLTFSPHLILSCFFQFAEGDIESQKDRVTCARWWVVVVFLSSPVICICPTSFIGSSQS